MKLQKLLPGERQGLGVTGAENPLSGTVEENQKRFDNLVIDFIEPTFNALIDDLTSIKCSDITDFSSRMTAKSDIGHTHDSSDVTGIDSAVEVCNEVAEYAQAATVACVEATENIEQTITDTKTECKKYTDGKIVIINEELGSKSPVGHLHTMSDVADLESAFNGKSDAGHSHPWIDIYGLESALNGKADLVNGTVPSSQLPSYVDDVLEFTSSATFPPMGEGGKIYVATDTNKTYRWSGSVYVEISPSLALGETSGTAYRGDKGKAAYDHSHITSGNPHSVKFSELSDKPVSLPASGGNADTVDNKHASDFAEVSHEHSLQQNHFVYYHPDIKPVTLTGETIPLIFEAIYGVYDFNIDLSIGMLSCAIEMGMQGPYQYKIKIPLPEVLAGHTLYFNSMPVYDVPHFDDSSYVSNPKDKALGLYASADTQNSGCIYINLKKQYYNLVSDDINGNDNIICKFSLPFTFV